MIKEKQITVYELHCDKCGEAYSKSTYNGAMIYLDEGQCLDDAVDDDWDIENGYLCPSCKAIGGAQ